VVSEVLKARGGHYQAFFQDYKERDAAAAVVCLFVIQEMVPRL